MVLVVCAKALQVICLLYTDLRGDGEIPLRDAGSYKSIIVFLELGKFLGIKKKGTHVVGHGLKILNSAGFGIKNSK